MTDYANDDVDRLRVIAQYCGGTEHGVFLAGLADRMEEVIVEAQPVFTREDMTGLRELAKQYNDEADNYEMTGRVAVWLSSIADRIERTLPVEAAVDVVA